MGARYLTALPVYNELHHLDEVLTQVKRYSPEILVVDDGSTDGTSEKLKEFTGIHVATHETNRGYGSALCTAFEFAVEHGYDVLVTIDCDGQHEPQRIPRFVEEAEKSGAVIISGSRYLQAFPGDKEPPAERKRINGLITAELNRRLGLNLTDAFCGFKAYRTSFLAKMQITEPGYAMPLEVWAQAARHCATIRELPVPLIYLEEKRSFGGALDDGATRLEYYHLVLDRSLAEVERTTDRAIDHASTSYSPCGDPC